MLTRCTIKCTSHVNEEVHDDFSYGVTKPHFLQTYFKCTALLDVECIYHESANEQIIFIFIASRQCLFFQT